MINTIGEDYVTMAHAKGLRDRRVMTRYAGRNAILPPLNGFASLFASAVGGLVFVEYIFSYPGAGYTLQQAVLGNDYALAQGILVVLSEWGYWGEELLGPLETFDAAGYQVRASAH